VLSAVVRGRADVPAELDTVLLMPRVSRLVLEGADGTTALLRNAGARRETATVALAGSGDVVVRSYDAAGRLQREVTASGTEITVEVRAGGFTIVSPAPVG
jgi:hypothetical protein